MAQITINYKLSEEGRKASLLAGGDGKEEQTLTADVTEELLQYGSVFPDGNAHWNVYDKTVRYKIYGGGSEKPSISKESRLKPIYFDAPQTVESLLAYQRAAVAEAEAEKVALEAELPDQIDAWEKRNAARKKEEEERKAKEAAEKAAEKAERDKIEAERAVREADRAAWIAECGSDYLRRAAALGYNCQRQYAKERAALEFPNFELDFDGYARWCGRSCPSEDALGRVERLISAGYKAKVVWLDKPVAEEDKDEDVFEPREAVVVSEYLGKYNLVNY